MLAASIFSQLLVYGLACLGAGAVTVAAIERLFGSPSPLSSLGRLASAFLLGQGVLASAWLVLALLGQFSSLLVGALLLLSLACCWFVARRDVFMGIGNLLQIAGELWRGPISLLVLGV